MDGSIVGSIEGSTEGSIEGIVENNDVGSTVGSLVGSSVGNNDDTIDGIFVFIQDGFEVVKLDGFLVVVNVDSTVGSDDDDIQDGSDEGIVVDKKLFRSKEGKKVFITVGTRLFCR